MDITRISTRREPVRDVKVTDVKVIDIEIRGKRYRLTESVEGRLMILGIGGESVVVHPCVANLVEIEVKD